MSVLCVVFGGAHREGRRGETGELQRGNMQHSAASQPPELANLLLVAVSIERSKSSRSAAVCNQALALTLCTSLSLSPLSFSPALPSAFPFPSLQEPQRHRGKRRVPRRAGRPGSEWRRHEGLCVQSGRPCDRGRGQAGGWRVWQRARACAQRRAGLLGRLGLSGGVCDFIMF